MFCTIALIFYLMPTNYIKTQFFKYRKTCTWPCVKTKINLCCSLPLAISPTPHMLHLPCFPQLLKLSIFSSLLMADSPTGPTSACFNAESTHLTSSQGKVTYRLISHIKICLCVLLYLQEIESWSACIHKNYSFNFILPVLNVDPSVTNEI